jgi:hypothetical protein
MAVSSGPNITQSGLVTYLDISNIDSFRGESTTNLVINPEFTSTSNWSVATNGGGSLSVSGGFGKIVMGTPGSFNYLNQSQNIAIPPNTICTWSAHFRNNVTGRFAIRLILFDGASVPAQPQTTVILDGTGGLKRYSVSASYVGTTTSVRLDILSGSFYATLSDLDVEFTKAQFELKPYNTPFVNGTRGTTVATGGGVFDISKNSTHAALFGTTFDSKNSGSLAFDGTDDYISIPEPKINLSPNRWTICFWINPGNLGSRFLTPQSNVIDQFLLYDPTNQRVQIAIATSADVNERTRGMGSNTAKLNTWSYICISLDENVIRMYSNGILTNTYTETLSIGNWSSTWVIGQRGNSTFWFLGNISQLMIFSEILTSTQILQNYNATKSRFGLS